MIKRIAGLGFKLSVVCAAAAFGLSYTYCITRDRIAQQIWESQIKAARAVLPEVEKNEDFKELEDLAARVKKEIHDLDKIFKGYREGNPAGYAVQIRPRGYGGPVTLMVGFSLDGVTTDIRVVEHRETPGLGSSIENEEWAGQFRGKKQGDQLKINKDIDAISGATISSKAVVKGVKEAIEAYAMFGGEGS